MWLACVDAKALRYKSVDAQLNATAEFRQTDHDARLLARREKRTTIEFATTG